MGCRVRSSDFMLYLMVCFFSVVVIYLYWLHLTVYDTKTGMVRGN